MGTVPILTLFYDDYKKVIVFLLDNKKKRVYNSNNSILYHGKAIKLMILIINS